MNFIVYDSGALIAAEKNDRHFLSQHRDFLQRGVQPIVPAGVLAQVWNPQPNAAILHWILKGCKVTDLTERIAKQSSLLCHRNGSADTIDASVVVTAIDYEYALILTDDIGDIKDLVAASGQSISVDLP
ncbi:MAG: twitching motility protein PilT [Candidatus Dormibacteraceae bacterium]